MLISFSHLTEDRSPLVRQVLGEGGLLERSFPGFEPRPQQLEMAFAVSHALENLHHLAVEAGTGVGKSYAYLVPAMEKIVNTKQKILISTFTITLQEQLIHKDIPFLSSIVPGPVRACLAKGRGNYLCLRRLEYAKTRQNYLFSDIGIEISRIIDWSKVTDDGSLSGLPFVPSAKTWDAVRSEHGNCRGRKCPHFNECFYRRARRALDAADLIVANHALMFSDLMLKAESYNLLPEYDYVIIDEAHNLEHVAEDHLGISVSDLAVTYLFNEIYNPRTRRGVLAYLKNSDTPKEHLKHAREAAKVFFAQVRAWYDHAAEKTGGRVHPEFVDDAFSPALRELRLELARTAKDLEDEDDQFELSRYIERCRELEISVREFVAGPKQDHVYWVEPGSSARSRLLLRSAPINPGPDIRRLLFEKCDAVITTSATLSCHGTDDKEGFSFFASQVGMEDYAWLRLGSPFDYRRQVTVYIEADLPDPNQNDFLERAGRAIKKYLLRTNGRAFVLFTSYSMLNALAESLDDWMREHDLDLLRQGGTHDRAELLDIFREDNRCVLFGTDSFWQGVDVPGEALSNVIIVRLPFAVPNHPLTRGRIEQLKKEGRDPFYDYQLPNAIIKFKQGFGRLIRTRSDSGIIVVLDSRIVRRGYGKHFLDSVPKARIEIVREGEDL